MRIVSHDHLFTIYEERALEAIRFGFPFELTKLSEVSVLHDHFYGLFVVPVRNKYDTGILFGGVPLVIEPETNTIITFADLPIIVQDVCLVATFG